MFLDGVELSEDALVGEEGKGFRYILDGMNAERILIASECIGDGRWFIKKAAAYASKRVIFGEADRLQPRSSVSNRARARRRRSGGPDPGTGRHGCSNRECHVEPKRIWRSCWHPKPHGGQRMRASIRMVAMVLRRSSISSVSSAKPASTASHPCRTISIGVPRPPCSTDASVLLGRALARRGIDHCESLSAL